MEERKETAQGSLGVGARLNNHDEKLKELKKKVTRLEQQVDAASEVGDLEISNKSIRICMDDGQCYEGMVVGISKFRVKLRMEGGKDRTFNKGHIRWHEEL